MPDAQKTRTRMSRPGKRFLAVLATCALMLTGGSGAAAADSIGFEDQKTVTMCTTALSEGARATQGAERRIAAASQALSAVKVTKLPKNAGTSTAYAKRPAAKTAKGRTIRASGATYIANVAKARDAVKRVTVPTQCADRDAAATIVSATASLRTATRTLDTRIGALRADFSSFQVQETKRITAEKQAAAKQAAAKKAAAKKAAAKKAAAKKAAAKKAAAKKAAAKKAAAKKAAAKKAAAKKAAAKKAANQRRGGGGGLFGTKSNGHCWTSNGMGGMKACG